ncbi:MAG: HAD hydrolase-like protein [Eubacterium sp.]
MESLGIKTDENIGEVMFEMTMEQGAKYLQDNYNVELSIEEICQGINDRVFEFYEKEAPEKPGIREVLEKAKKRKISMTIATSTDRPMIEAALKDLIY